MSAALRGVLGVAPGALAEACEAGDGPRAAGLLRAPQAGAARPVTIAGTPVWAEVRRLTRTDENQPPIDTVVLSALARLGGPLSFAVTCDPADGHRVRLGFDSPAALAWATRVWSPRVALAAATAPAAAAPARRAVRFRLAPAQDAAPTAALLERLLSVPGTWQVVANCTPVPAPDADAAASFLLGVSGGLARAQSFTESVDETRQVQVTEPETEQAGRTLASVTDHVARVRDAGGWLVELQVSAADPRGLELVYAAITAAGPGATADDAVWTVEQAPVATTGQALASLVTSGQLAGWWLTPPAASRAHVTVSAPMPLGRGTAGPHASITLGTTAGTTDRAAIQVADLAGHGFITGLTGSGKSTTVNTLLAQSPVPFLVIDPVKPPSEYAALAGVVDGLHVVTGSQLRMNVLAPWPGTDVRTHLGLVATAFRGSFSMPSPVPYVVSLLMDRAAELPDPTLHDLHDALNSLVSDLGFRGELEANIRASLGTRLAVLCAPHRAERLCAADATTLEAVLGRSTVVCLSDLGDEEERAFAMAALMIFVSEAARNRRGTGTVRHLTVVEEAHCLVAEPAAGGYSEDSGDAAGHAARLVSGLLAEARSFGEAVVIVDQSPSAVAREVTRNTNLKIAHRIVDPVDRELIGGAMGLVADETDFLAQLAPGTAALFTPRFPSAQLVQVAPPRAPADRTRVAAPAVRPPRLCCGDDVVAHHRAAGLGTDAEAVVQRAVARAYAHERGTVSAGTVRGELEALAARHPGTSVACLLAVGARATANTWQRLGMLDRAGADALRAAVVAGCGPAARGLQRGALPVVAAPVARPWPGCTGCTSACVVRPLASRHRAIGRVRTEFDRYASSATEDLIGSWRRRLDREFTDLLGAAGRDAAQCVLLHAVGDTEFVGPLGTEVA